MKFKVQRDKASGHIYLKYWNQNCDSPSVLRIPTMEEMDMIQKKMHEFAVKYKKDKNESKNKQKRR